MFKKIGILLIVLFFAGIISLTLSSRSNKKPDETLINKSGARTQTEKRASFAIYTNGTLRIFTDSKYHNQSDEVFINPDLPNQVTVLKSGTTWRDFFTTLPMKLEEDCLTTGTGQTFCNNEKYSLQFYINGVKNQKALDEEIKDNDKLLITYESEDSLEIQKQINSISDL